MAVVNGRFLPVLFLIGCGRIRWAERRDKRIKLRMESLPIGFGLRPKIGLIFMQVRSQVDRWPTTSGKEMRLLKPHAIRRILLNVIEERSPRAFGECHSGSVRPRHRGRDYFLRLENRNKPLVGVPFNSLQRFFMAVFFATKRLSILREVSDVSEKSGRGMAFPHSLQF